MAKIVVTDDGSIVVVGDKDTIKIEIPGAGGTVTIEADPDDNVGKFTIEFLDDAQADTAIVDLSTFSEDGLQIDIKKYDPSDKLILDGAFNKRVDPTDSKRFLFDYVGSDGNTYSGYVNAKDGGEKDFNTDPPPIVICFGKGTMILTDGGPRLVETLQPGDLVLTQDRGFQPVRWIGCRVLDSLDLARNPRLRPILVEAGALGHHAPEVNLVLSPQHRVQVEGWGAELYFGEDRVLVPVCHLVDGRSISVLSDASSVTYYHLLFDHHEVIMANGLASESLFLGNMALEALDQTAIAEVVELFPELSVHCQPVRPAGAFVRKHEASLLRRSVG